MHNPLLFSETDQKNHGYVVGTNKINVSSLQQYFAPVDSQGFAIKYVKEGTERYCINDEEYKVESGQYLVLNGQKNGSVLVDTNRNTKGICLNISQAFVEEVISFRRNPESNYADPALSAF